MPKLLGLLLLLPGLPLAKGSRSQGSQEPGGAGTSGVSGRWIVNSDFYGTPLYFSLQLKQDGEKLTGDFEGDKLEGTLNGSSVHFLAKDDQGAQRNAKPSLRTVPSPGP